MISTIRLAEVRFVKHKQKSRSKFIKAALSAPGGNRTRTAVAGNRILSPACLPVPPPGQGGYSKKIPLGESGILTGAEDRARTGHLDLGKVALYQMSYFRVDCDKNFVGGAKIIIRLTLQNFLSFLFIRPCIQGYIMCFPALPHRACRASDVYIAYSRHQTTKIPNRIQPRKTKNVMRLPSCI